MFLGCCFFLGGGYPEVLREMNFEKMPEKGRKKIKQLTLYFFLIVCSFVKL